MKARRFALLGCFLVLAACHAANTTPPATPPGNNGALGIEPGSAAANAQVGFAIAETPIQLTASDGTGLKLAALEAQAVVDGPLAFTELKMAFENPLDRTLEGTFRITLPQNASLGRFAMKINGEWQEGEVVELEAARRAYEDFLHRKQDPALMEKAAGNEFSARVFPIPAKGVKEIVVAYVEELHDTKYVLPLRGLPELGALEVNVRVLGAQNAPQRVTEKNTTPSRDYVVDLSSLGGDDPKVKASAVRNGELAIVRVRPQTTSKPEALNSVIVLVDTSASRQLGFEREIELVHQVARRVASENGTLTIATFDQTVTPIFDGPSSSFAAQANATTNKIRERGALGASNVERALAWAAETAKKNKARRVVLITDGVATAGATDPKKLIPKVAELKNVGIERMDALAIGGIRDDAGLLRMVRGNFAHDGVVADTTRGSEDVMRRLTEATRSNIAIKVEGATWTYPTKIDGAQSGDAFSVYVEIPAGKPLKVSIDGTAADSLDPRTTERPLIERAVAQAKVASLLEREITSKESLKKNITAIATQHRIMTPYTAMLVLETEQDYARYGIDRKSLRDVLAIQNGNVQRVHRTNVALVAKAPLRAPPGNEEGYGYELTEDPLSSAQDEKKKEDRGGASLPKPEERRAEKTAEAPSQPRPRPAPPAAQPQAPGRGMPAPAPTTAAAPRSVAPGPRPAGSSMAASGGAAPPAPPPPPAARAPRPMTEAEPDDRAPPSPAPARRRPAMVDSAQALDDSDSPSMQGQNPYEGRFASVMDQIKARRADDAIKAARTWHTEAPGDVLALVALGEAAEASEKTELAARAYGSIIDLFSNRSDLRRFAGERLERLSMNNADALDLAIDSFEKAAADRADHPSSHRLLTFALLRKKQFAKAFEAALAGVKHGYEVDRFAGVDRILREDLGLVGAAWAKAEPNRREEIFAKVRAAGGRVEDQPSLRFVLNWETDANDVDFHIHDGKGGHAFYSQPRLRSGGELYADVTTGYGPECFTIRGDKAKRAGPYKLEAHYYSRGPMGYGMGKLEVIDHDGNGNITFEERPFVVMVDSAFVDLGTVK